MLQATIALQGNKLQLNLENNSGVFSMKRNMNYHKEKIRIKLLYFNSCLKITSLSQIEPKIPSCYMELGIGILCSRKIIWFIGKNIIGRLQNQLNCS